MRCLRRDQERTLRRFSESFNEVQASLGAFKNDKTLKCFAELEIIEKDRDPALTVNLHKFITEFQSDEVDILNYKFKFTNTASGLQLDGDSRNIEDLTPKEILIKKLETEEVEEDKKIIEIMIQPAIITVILPSSSITCLLKGKEFI